LTAEALQKMKKDGLIINFRPMLEEAASIDPRYWGQVEWCKLQI
jgi:hypothetical protein